MEELRRFLQDNFPKWDRELICTGFEFDKNKLQRIEGIEKQIRRPFINGLILQGLPGVARDKVRTDTCYVSMSPDLQTEQRSRQKWAEAAIGQEGELKVYQMVQRIFQAEPGLLLSGFKENDLLALAKQSLDPGLNKTNSNLPIPTEVGITVDLVFNW